MKSLISQEGTFGPGSGWMFIYMYVMKPKLNEIFHLPLQFLKKVLKKIRFVL